jgi:ketol-acid reductoisomerase
MGKSVRRLYEQGKSINGAGINCSFAIEQDVTGDATDIALGWGTAIGAPYMFETTLGMEWRSDISGERAILLGAVHGLVESLYRNYVMLGAVETTAFSASVENITGPISKTISQQGIIGLYNALPPDERMMFQKIYTAAYGPYYELMTEIYDEVSSGNEIRSVELAGQRLKKNPMGKIDGTRMWEVGEIVRSKRNGSSGRLNPITAGFYCAIMMAQIDLFESRGHCWSEICNETVIESVDSLNPYMHARGVAYMVDNCSITARTGSRKWAPRWDYVTMQQILPIINGTNIDEERIDAFEKHPVHDALAVCAKMRPPVDISVQ